MTGAFDPDLALRFLRFREEKRRGQAKVRGRVPAPPTIGEVTDKLERQINAIRRHRQAEQLAQGWSQDEEGRMIPPGWVHAQPPE